MAKTTFCFTFLKNILSLTFLICTIQTFAATRTYSGLSGGNWLVATNWSPTGVPVAGDDVYIPAGKTVIVTGNLGPVIRTVVVEGVIDLTDNGKLEVSTGAYLNGAGRLLGNSPNDQFRIGPDTYANTAMNSLTGNFGSFANTYPVEISSLKSYNYPNHIALVWQLFNEYNFDRFIVQRSSDAINFATIGELPSSGPKEYSYIDETPTMGDNYYRLQMLDFDMTFEYSPIIYSRFNNVQNQSWYPNPVRNNEVSLAISDVNQLNSISFSTIDGKLVAYQMSKSNGEIKFTFSPDYRGKSIIATSSINGLLHSTRLQLD